MSDFKSVKGLFFHTFRDGKLQYQGKVLRRSGVGYVCQMFEWVMGFENGTETFTEEFLRSDNCALYSKYSDWLAAGSRFSAINTARRAESANERQ